MQDSQVNYRKIVSTDKVWSKSFTTREKKEIPKEPVQEYEYNYKNIIILVLILLLILLVVLYFTGVLSNPFESSSVYEKDNVYVLGSKNFQMFIDTNEYVFVKFAVPWCKHCKALGVEFLEVAKEFTEDLNNDLKLAEVNCEKHAALQKQYKIKGFPTLLFFKNGKFQETYKQDRTKDAMVSWLKRKSGDILQKINLEYELDNLKKNNDVVIAYFGKNTHNQNLLANVASEQFSDLEFALYEKAAYPNKYNVKEAETLIIFKKFDEYRVIFRDQWTANTLAKFLKKNSVQTITPFNNDIFPKTFHKSEPFMVLFYDDNVDNADVLEVYQQAAEKLKGQILITQTNYDEENDMIKDFIVFLHVQKKNLPKIKIAYINKKEDINSKELDKPITVENIEAFFKEWEKEKSKLKKYTKDDD